MKKFFNRFLIAIEFIKFLHRKKLWWLIPIVIILFILALILIFTQAVPFFPFVYPFF